MLFTMQAPLKVVPDLCSYPGETVTSTHKIILILQVICIVFQVQILQQLEIFKAACFAPESVFFS